SRQRLYDPATLAGTYSGNATSEDGGYTGTGSMILTVAGNGDATVTLTLFGQTFGPMSGTFNADGELIINGASTFNQLVNFRLHADGSFSILLVNLGHQLFTPIDEIRWVTAFGEFAPPRGGGSILIGHVGGALLSGSLTFLKQ